MRSIEAATAKSPRARRAAEPRADRKQAILLAAEKLFAHCGYHAVTIRQIAQEAEVPLALGYCYGRKHELSHAIFDHWNGTIKELLGALRQVAADVRLTQTSFQHRHWTAAQMLAHHGVVGCNLQPGDLLGSGTISVPSARSRPAR